MGIDESTRDLAPTATGLPALLALDDSALFTTEGLSAALDLLKKQAGGIVGDVSTERGRRDINMLSRGVGGAIIRMDDRRKAYVADLKARPAAIDRLFREQFREPAEAVKAAIRAPLDAWHEEQREADEEVGRILAALNAPIAAGTAPAIIADRLTSAMDTEMTEWMRPDHREAIAVAQADAITRLRAAYTAAQAAEEHAAELAALRVQAAKRAEADRIAQIAAEAEARALAAVAGRERQAVLAAERAERAEADFAEATRRAAEAESRAEQDSERQRMAIIAERERMEREALEKSDVERREQDRLKADREHRRAVLTAAKHALIDAGVPADQARAALVAIADERVPRVNIQW